MREGEEQVEHAEGNRTSIGAAIAPNVTSQTGARASGPKPEVSITNKVSSEPRDPIRPPSRADTRLIKLACVVLAAGVVASVLELIALGHLTAPVLALDSIGCSLLPLGIIALVVGVEPAGRPRNAGEEEDGGGGGGGSRRDGGRPGPPSGGLEIDWGRFEREFQLYAQRAGRTLEPSRA